MKQVFTQDGHDLLMELDASGVRFVVVGAHALAVHGVSRATVDLDVLVEPETGNTERVIHALCQFGAPLAAHGITRADFERPDTIYQMGLPPNRIDVITSISGVSFERAWVGRVTSIVDGLVVPFLGRTEMLVNKRAAGRAKDLADVEALEAMDSTEQATRRP